MAICNDCGKEIDLITKNGKVIKIHKNGSCVKKSLDRLSYSPKTNLSYDYFVNPNSSCPVCKKSVFYYENSFGSKVYFDFLGPPWPKHFCTNRENESRALKRLGNVKSRDYIKDIALKNMLKAGKWVPFILYQAVYLKEYKGYFYSLQGYVGDDLLTITLVPSKKISIHLNNIVFIRKVKDEFYEITALIDGDELFIYTCVAFLDIREALNYRRKVSKTDSFKSIISQVSNDNLASCLIEGNDFITDLNKEYVRYLCNGLCEKCSKPVYNYSFNCVKNIVLEKNCAPWIIHDCDRDLVDCEDLDDFPVSIRKIRRASNNAYLIDIVMPNNATHKIKMNEQGFVVSKKMLCSICFKGDKSAVFSTFILKEGKINSFTVTCEVIR